MQFDVVAPYVAVVAVAEQWVHSTLWAILGDLDSSNTKLVVDRMWLDEDPVLVYKQLAGQIARKLQRDQSLFRLLNIKCNLIFRTCLKIWHFGFMNKLNVKIINNTKQNDMKIDLSKLLKLYVKKMYGTNQEILEPNITRFFLETKNKKCFNLIIIFSVTCKIMMNKFLDRLLNYLWF